MLSVLPDAVVTTAATPVTINVLANDSGTNLTITSFSNPGNGSLVFNPDKTFTYTPQAGFVGEDGFSYTVRDAQGTPASAEVAITVTAASGTVATNDVAEVTAGSSVAIPVLANDLVAAGGTLAISAVGTPGHGVVSIQADQTIIYAPQSGFAGIDSFTYTVTDGLGGSATATVTVMVLSANRPPVARPDSFTVIAGQPTLLAVLENDSDPENGPLQVVGFTMPNHGSLVFNPDKTFTYTPQAGFLGLDHFTYTIRDNRGASASAEVSLAVIEIREQPEAVADHVTTTTGVPVTIDVLANDLRPEGQEIAIIAVTLPYKGSLVFNPDQTITYTPHAGFVGTDDFGYTIGNGKGDTSQARVIVEVTPAGEATTYANGYGCRRRIAVPASAAQGATHEGFPFLFELAGDWLKSTANGGKVASPTGQDLRFELADGTKLPHEIERYDAAAGRLAAWVRLPALSASQTTTLLLYYGKPGLSGSEAQPAAVWQDYLAVWHLPEGASAKGDGRTLLPVGTVGGSPDAADKGIALNGAGLLTLADSAWLSGHAALTMQLRSKAYSTGHDRGQLNIGSFVSDAESALGLRYQAAGWGTGQPTNVVHTKLRTSLGDTGVSSPGGRHTTDWQSIAVAWQTGDSQPTLYLDGAAVSPSFTKTIGGPATTLIEGPLHLGAGPRDSAEGGWVGAIGEVRFCSKKLDAAWLAAEHANLSAPTLLYGVGSEETLAETVGLAAMPLTMETELGKWVEFDVVAAAILLPGTSAPTIQGFTQPAHGTVSVIGGKIRYAPGPEFVGQDSFSFTLAADGKTSRAMIAVVVKAAPSGEQGGGGDSPNVTYLRTVNVASASQLTAALNNARAGDDIVLADGTYGGSFTLAKDGTATNPIRVRAANAHRAVLTGRIDLTGRWGTVRQLQFNGGTQAARIHGHDCRVSRCRFNNTLSAAIVLMATCRRPEVDYNYIENYDFRGISGEATPSDYPRNPHIHHNHLKNQVSTNGGGIIMGQAASHTNHMIGAIIEYNLVDGFNGIEPISAKSSGNLFRFNTLKNAEGVLMCRHGTYNDYIGNASLNAGGVMLMGRWNRAIGNYHDGGKTGSWRSPNAASGTVSQSQILTDGGGGAYPRAEDCLFAGNIGPLIIGGGGSSSELPPLRTIIEAHQGPISTPRQSGTIHRALTVAVPPYVILKESDVGPAAGLAD